MKTTQTLDAGPATARETQARRAGKAQGGEFPALLGRTQAAPARPRDGNPEPAGRAAGGTAAELTRRPSHVSLPADHGDVDAAHDQDRAARSDEHDAERPDERDARRDGAPADAVEIWSPVQAWQVSTLSAAIPLGTADRHGTGVNADQRDDLDTRADTRAGSTEPRLGDAAGKDAPRQRATLADAVARERPDPARTQNPADRLEGVHPAVRREGDPARVERSPANAVLLARDDVMRAGTRPRAGRDGDVLPPTPAATSDPYPSDLRSEPARYDAKVQSDGGSPAAGVAVTTEAPAVLASGRGAVAASSRGGSVDAAAPERRPADRTVDDPGKVSITVPDGPAESRLDDAPRTIAPQATEVRQGGTARDATFATELTIAAARYTLPGPDDRPPAVEGPAIVARTAELATDKPVPPPSPALLVASTITAEPSWRPAPVAPMTQLQPHHAPLSPKTLQVQLNPGRLGVVTATLSMSGTQLKVELLVTSAEAHDRLRGEEHVIEKAMQALGYDVGQVTISQSSIVPTTPVRTDAAAPMPVGRDQPSADGRAPGNGDRGSGQQGGHDGNERSGGFGGRAARDPDRERRGLYI